MADNHSSEPKIPVLKDVVIAVTPGDASPATAIAQPSLLSSTLQAEIDAIIIQARADFEATIAQLQLEMQQRVERELNELHVQLTSDD
jgi:hypothetical protein